MARSNGDAAKRPEAAGLGQLPPELLANIHDRLEFLDRIAFATVFAASCGCDDDNIFSPPAPWLLLTGEKNKDSATATLFSFADRRAATVRASDPAMRGHLVIGSSRGWLATADDSGQIYVVNPATGEQRAFPDINTMGVFLPSTDDLWSFKVWIERFLTARFGGGPPFPDNGCGPERDGETTFHGWEMGTRFYRKVILAIGRCPESHAAMLILNRKFGAPAFATAEDGGAWRLAPSPDGVEDAIHHDGRFHSVSYWGVVEAWERDAESGAYTSTAVAPRLLTIVGNIGGKERKSPCKYLAAAPDGRLMVVVKHVQIQLAKHEWHRWLDMRRWAFKVHVLGDDGQWRDIGNAALFVGVNNSLCMHREKDMDYSDDDDERDGHVVDEDVGVYSFKEVQAVGVYSLKDGTVKKIGGLNRQTYRSFTYTPPVWITPSIP
ncbi:hypothetical protein QYE76_059393 [Lolium multiflorum]|uniref:KIB1-4 beta-propeller domain-containing protein n=1 Tax=Lolium multiflorum TaxID=4521 RepID=A0AAD8RYK0_LOLMU|nr:hypothetical protein QYE76_059393 [Lolium multiflorum]